MAKKRGDKKNCKGANKFLIKDKKGFAMSFNWIFAIIVGAVILFLAIYGTSKFIITSEQSLYTESSARLISLLDPFETGLASGKSAQINFKKQTRTFYDCSEFDNRPFGRQTIAFSEQTIGDKFGDRGGDVVVKNKYIFAEEVVEGRSLNIFSKPFYMPFKVADMIIISSDDYCFYQAPEEIQDEIEILNIKNIVFTDDLDNCTNMKKVCWGGADCDVEVSQNRVVKNNQEVYYSGDLIYAAIFSSPEIYECNIKRLKNKFNELVLIYNSKANVLKQYGCGSQLSTNLEILRNKDIESSKDVINWQIDSDKLDLINQGAKSGCELY